jgi:hypothetical protein
MNSTISFVVKYGSNGMLSVSLFNPIGLFDPVGIADVLLLMLQ